jgi:hypothetical protein
VCVKICVRAVVVSGTVLLMIGLLCCLCTFPDGLWMLSVGPWFVFSHCFVWEVGRAS